jgi:hypothetical protein
MPGFTPWRLFPMSVFIKQHLMRLNRNFASWVSRILRKTYKLTSGGEETKRWKPSGQVPLFLSSPIMTSALLSSLSLEEMKF